MKNSKMLAAASALALGMSAFAALGAQADYVPHSPEANKAAYWETYFADKGYTDVECFKIDEEMKSYIAGGEYIGVILKAGAGDEANKVFTDIAKDTELTHPTGKDISHVIACTGTMPVTDDPSEEPSEPVEEPSKPVEEPSEPVEEPSKPVEEPSKPVEEPSAPVEEPSKPTDPCEPSKPADPCDDEDKGDDKGDDKKPSKPGDDKKPSKPGKPGLPKTGV